MTFDPLSQVLAAPGTRPLPSSVADVYPQDSCINEKGRLEIGGCDVIELAREFGTPSYVFAEKDLWMRAEAVMGAFSVRADRFEVLYASKAFPCTPALKIFAKAGLSCDVASEGEMRLAIGAGFDASRIYMHGNNKTDEELKFALSKGIGHIIIDSFDEIERLRRLAPRDQPVLLRVTPGIQPDTHVKISTGQADSKFGIPLAQLPRAVEACAAAGLSLCGLHGHIGSQVFDLDVYEKLAEVLLAAGEYPVVNMGGGFAAAYTRDQHPPSAAQYAEAMLKGLPNNVKVLCEPGRSLVANAGVTLYTVGTVKDVPLPTGSRKYVAVDGGMADNIRPMLYEATYEAEIADRFGDSTACRVVGMHCESGDILVENAALENPQVDDVLVMPATGAYGHAMASNYAVVRRPPVVFCRDGDARAVVRRETYDDMTVRELE